MEERRGEFRKWRNQKWRKRYGTPRTHSSYFPENDPVRPDVRAGGELPGLNGFKSHPLQWESAFGLLHIHLLHLTRQPEISDLQVLSFPNQDVSTRQVTMHYVDAGQVLLKKR